MFEIQRLQGTPERRIEVQTRAGYSLDNFLAPPPGGQQLSRYQRIRDKHPGWSNRKPASGGYNCAGLIWASRRVSLPSAPEWRRVLNDDGYRHTDFPDVLPGDIVLYLKASDPPETAEILHVACVYFFRNVGGVDVPMAVSKWDAQCGEDIHDVQDCAQLCGGEPHRIQYWTERPIPERQRLKV
jgi:hypothetical protein